MGWWVADLLNNNPALLVAQIFWVVFSICLHELGHGFAAIRLGDRTPIESGHMTWNPLVHMGWPSLIMFALTGFAWGMMPVNPSRLRGARSDAIVAAAGPAVNLGLAIVSTVLLALWVAYAKTLPPSLYQNFTIFFLAGAYLNLILMVFNLLPAPPLDGSRIVAEFIPGYARLIAQPQAAMVGFIVVLIAFNTVGQPVRAKAMDIVQRSASGIVAALP